MSSNHGNVRKRWIWFVLFSLLLIMLGIWALQMMNQPRESIEGWKSVNDEVKAALVQPEEVKPEEVKPEEVQQNKNSPININQADVKELGNLPGIGPVKAQAIVDYRTENGNFQSKEEIMKVKGIGPKTYERLQLLIILTD
jgi:comEA protein